MPPVSSAERCRASRVSHSARVRAPQRRRLCHASAMTVTVGPRAPGWSGHPSRRAMIPVVPLTAADLDVELLGTGPRVVLVHGSIVDARRTWRHQPPLADRWTLCLPNRPGFANSPPLARGDFEAEAPLIAELLEDGAHLVGHSYGAVIALYVAALRPQAVRSLTVSEPGCLAAAAGNPLVDAQIAHGETLYAAAAT